MRAKVLTLRFSPQLGRFDDGELIALQRRVVAPGFGAAPPTYQANMSKMKI